MLIKCASFGFEADYFDRGINAAPIGLRDDVLRRVFDLTEIHWGYAVSLGG